MEGGSGSGVNKVSAAGQGYNSPRENRVVSLAKISNMSATLTKMHEERQKQLNEEKAQFIEQ